MRWVQGMNCRSAAVHVCSTALQWQPLRSLRSWVPNLLLLFIFFIILLGGIHSSHICISNRQGYISGINGSNPVTLLSSTRWCWRWTAEEKDRAQRSPGAGSLARGPSGAVQQLVLWIRPSPVGERLLHNTRVAPHHASTASWTGAASPAGRQGMWSTFWLLPCKPRPAKVIRCSTPI